MLRQMQNKDKLPTIILDAPKIIDKLQAQQLLKVRMSQVLTLLVQVLVIYFPPWIY